MATRAGLSDQSVAGLMGQLLVVRGVMTVLFGVFVLVWPGLTTAVFLLLLALWLFVSGVVHIVGSLVHRSNTGNWLLRLLLGMLQVGVGAYLVQRPGVTLLTIVTLIGLVLVVDGVVGVAMSLFEPGGWNKRLGAMVLGVVAVVIGVMVWRYPLHGTLAFLWLLGLYSLIAGSFMLAEGVELGRAS